MDQPCKHQSSLKNDLGGYLVLANKSVCTLAVNVEGSGVAK